MDSLPKPSPGLRKGYKKVRFKRDSILEEVRIIECREPRRRDRHQQKHTCSQECSQSPARSREKDKALNIYEVPPLFRCMSCEDICDVIKAGKGAIADVFQGYTVLQWYCNAKSTSPGIIQALLHHGVDINALDQRTHKSGRPVIRHTALGYACRNANVKAVHTLLQNGADPRGLTESAASLGMQKQDAYGNPIIYPSPLQELLCQRIHGPRPGQCPGTYHLTEEDEDNDDYLDEDDPERMPVFHAFSGLSDTLSEYGPICKLCAADFHIWEPWPETEEEKVAARERRRSCYYDQIQRLGNRIHKCVQLLLDYGCSCPPVAFPEGDDPHLWSGIDYLLETFWHFFHPLTLCESRAVLPEESYLPMSPEHLSQISRPIFSVFGEICDMLLESARYEAKGTVGTTRGQDRLLRLIAEHPEFSSFRQGEYFDVDTQLEKELLKGSSTSR
ncbi:hypothetical protein F4860DRAFT_512172 [Xylaria cubensis]|nr:hypothetical protein F4860DRAFT_512172 [Xylaria cubensis]